MSEHTAICCCIKACTSADNKSCVPPDSELEEGVCDQLQGRHSDWPLQWWRNWRPSYHHRSLPCISGTAGNILYKSTEGVRGNV